MSKRQWYNALSGLWARRYDPAAGVIVADALEAAECVSLQMGGEHRELFDAIERAKSLCEDIELMARDSRGCPVVVQIHPETCNGELCLHVVARYPRHRLYQMVGEM